MSDVDQIDVNYSKGILPTPQYKKMGLRVTELPLRPIKFSKMPKIKRTPKTFLMLIKLNEMIV